MHSFLRISLLALYVSACGSADSHRSSGGGDEDASASGGSAGSNGTGGSGGRIPASGGAPILDASTDHSVEDSGAGGSADDAASGGTPSTLPEASPSDGGCVPTSPATEVCDRLDNDCNGLKDDVDVGGDGIYDCLHFALTGNSGAFVSSDFEKWLGSNGVLVERIQTTATAGNAVTAGSLDAYDVVILDRLTRAYTPEEAAVFEAFVAAGGGLMSLTGYTGGTTDLTFPNSILASFGLAYQGPLSNQNVTTFFPHPTTEGLTSISFKGGFFVVPGEDTWKSEVVASLPGGPVGAVSLHGAGRVFVWGDEWVEYDSEWKTIPQVKQFWVNVIGWLGHFR